MIDITTRMAGSPATLTDVPAGAIETSRSSTSSIFHSPLKFIHRYGLDSPAEPCAVVVGQVVLTIFPSHCQSLMSFVGPDLGR